MPQSSRERLSNIRVSDPVLTELARGHYNQVCIGESIMPVVMVDKEGGKIPEFGREAFKVKSTIRAIRGKSNRLDPENIGSKDYLLDEYDLEYPMDYREVQEASYDLPAYATSVVKDGLDLTRERQIAELALNEANYGSENKIVLSGDSQFTSPKADIPAIVDDAVRAIKRVIGRKPNVMVVSGNVYSVMRRHPSLLGMLASTSVKSIDAEKIAELLEIDEVVVGEAVYDDEKTGEIIDIWADDIVIAYVPKGKGNLKRNIYEPAYAYTLRKRDALKVDRYEEDGGKVEVVRSTDISNPFIVGSDAGYLIKNAVSSESTEG